MIFHNIKVGIFLLCTPAVLVGRGFVGYIDVLSCNKSV